MKKVEVVSILKQSGFTGIQARPAPFPVYLKVMFDDEDSQSVNLDKIGREMGYLRIVTDQGEFGLWRDPNLTLDLHGTGLNWDDLGNTEDINHLPLEMREIAGVDENTLSLLWQKLVQRKTKP